LRPLLLVSVLAASLLLAAACGGGGDEDERVAGIIHRLVAAAQASDAGAIERFPGELPEGLPAEPPLYPDADLIGSSRILAPPAAGEETGAEQGPSGQTALYFIVLDTDDDRERVFAFYEDALDEEPWQLDALASVRDLDRLEFSNVDDEDIVGVVQLVTDEDGERTSIFISLQDAGARAEEEPPFEPGTRLPVLRRFPEDVPRYDGAIVTSAAFQRSGESESFLLIFLTEDSQDAVASFYQEAFEELGWTVEEREAVGSEQRLHFEDEERTIEGDLTVDRFVEDDRYTEVDLRVQVSSGQEPEDSVATATPEADTESE